MNTRLLLSATIAALLLSWGSLAENRLPDADFASATAAGGVWKVQAEAGGLAESAKAMDGKRGALHLKNGKVVQTCDLGPGLYELTVEAKGQGELLLQVAGSGERAQMLGKDWATFGYLFERAAVGAAVITVAVPGDGTVTGAALTPATPAQQAGWAKELASLRQFGFVTASAQRPAPGVPELRFDGDAKPLAAMERRAVLDEPRLNLAHTKNVDRLVVWLGANGFARLDGEKLPDWVGERIQKGDAYGSVSVLPRGMSPIRLMAGAENKPLWLEYLRAGGRIVHIGDLPFNYGESPDPTDLRYESAGSYDKLGLDGGWNSPYWGQGGLAVTLTPAARAWGLEIMDGPVTGFAVEAVSIPFGVYTVPATGRQGAASWFKNIRPDLPWSGLIKMQQHFDGANDTALRDIWRAAHYVGSPVAVPPLPAPVQAAKTAPVRILLSAGGMKDRHEFVRGETVGVEVKMEKTLSANAVRLELRGVKDDVAASWNQPAAEAGAAFALDTAPYTFGEYTLRAVALRDGQEAGRADERVGIRFIQPEYFNWEAWAGAGSNPVRSDLEFADIRNAGMEVYLVQADAANVDVVTRQGMGFSLRAHPDFSGGREWTFEKNPEYFRLSPDGKPVGTAYSGGRPSLGISHPDIRANATKSLADAVMPVAQHPGFRPYVLCNDDFSIYYGWDYAPHVLADFKAQTGLDAPRKLELPAAFGAIPENNAWLRWFEYNLVSVDGAYNQAETAGVLRARADARIGPIPGGMQIPLVSMWEPAQYPPYNFGKNGFNLICSYYYNTYWQPVLTVTFWMQIGRMGNRDLPEWNMPDAFSTAGYTRNNLFLYWAGGVRGLAYFTYSSRNANSWGEFHRLGPLVRRLGPTQAALAPAATHDIGMLNSFTTNCFDPGHTLLQVYGFHNLAQAHFDVEMVSEDEIVAGRASRYQAIVLYNVKYLRQTVFDALAAHAAKGGRVILDSSVPFEIPGAVRVPVDIGMGNEKTLPFPPEGAHVSTPGIRDYGIPERVATIKRALAAQVRPAFASDDIHVVATRFAAEGVPYTWFVNVHDGKEYMFCRERMGAGHPGAGSREKVQQVRDWETAESAKGPYTAALVMDAQTGVPWDVVGMKAVPVTRTADGRVRLEVSMERFGGALVTWLPADPGKSKFTLDAPRKAAAGTPVTARARLAMRGKPLPGVFAVAFQLRDPAGNESVVSGVRQMRNGVAEFAWTPAVNDPLGAWTLTAVDQISGKQDKVTIDVLTSRK